MLKMSESVVRKGLISLLLVCSLCFSLLGTAVQAAPLCREGKAVVTCIRDVNIKGTGKYIFYPASLETSNETYPIVVWANGTGCITLLYAKLLRTLAQAGYIVVADTSVMSADGKKQIDSIDYIFEKNNDTDSVFYGKVDTENICAAGQSQGGRSSINAAASDSRITSVLSLAGASTAEEAEPVTCPTFFVTGSADFIVLSSMWVKPSYEAVQGKAVYASLKNGVHTTYIFRPERLSGYAVLWLDASLKNDAQAASAFAANGSLSADGAWQDFKCK